MERTKRQWWQGAYVGLALGMAACSPSKAEGVAPSEARAAVERGAILLDVRSPGEFSGGHLTGAINIPVDALGARSGELAADREVVVYCRSGRRSAAAATLLREQGRQVIDVGPMEAW